MNDCAICKFFQKSDSSKYREKRFRYTLWEQPTIEITRAYSIYTSLRHIYMGVVSHVHPICGESHIQHNANREVATYKLPAIRLFQASLRTLF